MYKRFLVGCVVAVITAGLCSCASSRLDDLSGGGADDASTSERSGRPDSGTTRDVADDRGSEDGSEDSGLLDVPLDTLTEDAAVSDQEIQADTEDDQTDEPSVVDLEPIPDAGPCIEVHFDGEEGSAPADIIWIIDSSESMDNEIEMVRTNINDFAGFIGDAGIDYRVIMVASDHDHWGGVLGLVHWYGVCVPPPLSGAASCPDVDSAVYLHVREDVYSNDGLQVFIDSFAAYRGFLRPAALQHIVMVTDDESDRSPSWFRDEVASRAELHDDLTFHSIIQQPGETCGDNDGDRYIELSTASGGVIESICESDWAPIFTSIQESVVDASAIPCIYAIPEPEDYFLEVDYERVNVYFTPPEGEPELLVNVDNEAGCGEAYAWYYDDPDEPTSIRLCPAVCGIGVEGSIEIALGCGTIKD